MTNFSIDQELFSNVLQQHIPVIPSRSTLPILISMRWQITGDKLLIHSTDLEISLITISEVHSDEDGEAAVPARKVADIVRELPPEQINITLDESYRVNINSANGVYKIAGSNPDDFPAMPSSDTLDEIIIPSSKFKRMVNHASFSVSKDDLRPTLCGVYFQVFKDEYRMVSTDGHRLSKIVDFSGRYDGEPFNMIIPLKGLNLSARTLADNIDLTISRSKNFMKISSEEGDIYSRLIEGKYPLYENVIPKGNPNIMTANVENMMSTVRRVAIFSSSISHQVRFQISAEKAVITAEDVDIGGEAQEEIKVDYQGEDILIGYNANYLIDALRQIETEDVKFLIGTPDSAGIIVPTEQNESEDYLMLLMPVRLT